MSEAVTSSEMVSPFEYPGARREGNFLVVGGSGEVIAMPASPRAAFDVLDEYLSARELPTLSDRIPVLAFGSNASPAGISRKMAILAEEDGDNSTFVTVPMLSATLAGHDVVWHGRPAQKGGIFAELLKSNDTKDTDVAVVVQFLTDEQLQAVHKKEGPTYGIGLVEGIDLGEGLLIDALAYIAEDASVLLDETGAPIAVSGINRNRSNLEVMNARQALSHILGSRAVIETLGRPYDPDEFLQEGRALELPRRKSRQLQVQRALNRDLLTWPYRYASRTARYKRTDFESLPRGTGVSLPAEKLPISEE